MNIDFKIEEGTLIIMIDGELDHHNSVDVREKADEIFDREKCKNIIFDLNGMKFMDSSAIGVIMGRYKRTKNVRGKTAIVNTSPQLQKIIDISGLCKIINIYTNIQDALQEI